VDCFGASGRAEENFSFQWAKSPHLRHRRHGLHIVRDDFFIAYIKVISSLIPSFLLSPKSLRFPGTPILFTHGLHIVRDDFFIAFYR
jgi:hypothetical protein